ncbi:hypothetical protein [Nostoc sp. JL31]|uniref:hypothetical protein n=1 Tax=Nostoc sp. JL31 TaxID=2815395 RepID=UPI0025F868E6|nr:hypothetical protein [Nostoc sp. JL31]
MAVFYCTLEARFTTVPNGELSDVRSPVISSVTSVIAPNGTLLLITRVRDTEAEISAPPWPLSARLTVLSPSIAE